MKNWYRFLKLLLLISILPLGYLLTCYDMPPAPNTLELHLSEFNNPPDTVWMPPGERWLFWGDDRNSGFFLAYCWIGDDWEVMGFFPYTNRCGHKDTKELYLKALGLEEEKSPWD